jgi:carbon storage regulator
MLVLTRRVGATIMLGDDIEIEVLDVRAGVVRLGVKAPKSVRVLRGELLTEVASANAEAVTDGGLELLDSLHPTPQPVTRANR